MSKKLLLLIATSKNIPQPRKDMATQQLRVQSYRIIEAWHKQLEAEIEKRTAIFSSRLVTTEVRKPHDEK